MALAVPVMQDSDWHYVQNLREQYDPNGYAFVEPHFTMVSLSNKFSKTAFTEILAAQLAQQAKISFCLRTAIFMPPLNGHQSWYTFLMPDEGFSGLNRLHSRIHQGPLQQTLAENFPFIPHLTVGKFTNRVECLRLVKVINKAQLELSGWITKILLVEACEIGRAHV